jgi:ankyrin repeat protein
MSKYMHEYNTGRCRKCGQNGCYETEEGTEELVKTSDLLTCFGCNSVQYCCKEHQKEDWPNHKVFCKRFRKCIAEYKTLRDSRPRRTAKPEKPSPYPLHDFIEKADWQGLLHYITVDHPTYDVNEIDDRSPDFMSPLILACGQGQIECVHILLERGANFTDECASTNMTPLIYASWWGHADIVQLLLNRGADVNQMTIHNAFALGYAAQHLQPQVVALLLRYGANVDQRNFFGWTPLMCVCCMGETTQEPSGENDASGDDLLRKMLDNRMIIMILNQLLDAGADINARGHSSFEVHDFKGDTALNLSADRDKIDVLKFLISKDALLDVQRECKSQRAEYNFRFQSTRSLSSRI